MGTLLTLGACVLGVLYGWVLNDLIRRRRSSGHPMDSGNAILRTGHQGSRRTAQNDSTRSAAMAIAATDRSPLVGFYDWGEPGMDVVIYEGPIDFGPDRHDGQLALSTASGLNIVWDAEEASFADLAKVGIGITLADLGEQRLAALVLNTDGKGTLEGQQNCGGGLPMHHLVVHWFNLPRLMRSTPLETATGIFAGRWECKAAGWTITIDCRPDLDRVTSALNGTAHCVMTHVGDVRRSDGSSFDVTSAESILFGLQMALSFAFGRWVAPALPVGVTSAGRRTWQQLGAWRCDTFHGYHRWMHGRPTSDLSDFVRSFLDAWTDPAKHDVVKYFTHHVIAANHSGTTVEGRLMILQAGMEYLSWCDNVISKGLNKEQYKTLNPNAERVVQNLLVAAGIPLVLPPELDVLISLASSGAVLDGPAALTRVRNKLVHPKDPAAVYGIDGLVVQAWQLSMHYGVLLLLGRLNYVGCFLPPFPPGRFVFDAEVVPWNTSIGPAPIPP